MYIYIYIGCGPPSQTLLCRAHHQGTPANLDSDNLMDAEAQFETPAEKSD